MIFSVSDYSSQKWIIFLVVVTLGLLIFNHQIISFGILVDGFGVVGAIVLFAIGGKPVSYKVQYCSLILVCITEFISYRLHTKSMHFMAICTLVCMIYYFVTKRFSIIAFVCILVFSSIFDKIFEQATAEIKQFLCEIVFYSLQDFLNLSNLDGIHFYKNNEKISIDTACMGLSMFKTGFLFGAFLLTLAEQKQKKCFSFLQIILLSVIIVFLNIVSNYFRILTLVVLQCTQENFLHHFVGICCFVIYQILPLVFIIRYIKPNNNQNTNNQSLKLFVPIVSILIIGVTSLEMQHESKNELLLNMNKYYNLNQGKWVNNEVFKIQTSDKLIYIKTISHNPLVCWTGDGYSILNQKKVIYKNEMVWKNNITKNNKNYQSIWWYECDNKKYTSFVNVMLMKLWYNKPTRLINEVIEFRTKTNAQ